MIIDIYYFIPEKIMQTAPLFVCAVSVYVYILVLYVCVWVVCFDVYLQNNVCVYVCVCVCVYVCVCVCVHVDMFIA